MPIALLQTVMERLLSPEIIWIFIPVLALSIPIIAMIFEPIKQRLKQAERREARQIYERLALEKLDVLKTAIAMGYQKGDIADLDARLEKLLGSDKLKTLLESSPKAPLASSELQMIELGAELERQRTKQG
jgi:hypothetical protein